MQAVSREGSQRLATISIVVGLITAVFLTVYFSVAAFSDTTESFGVFETAEVLLSDDHEGEPMFNETNIVPGWEATAEIVVTNDSTVETDVAHYLSDLDDGGLAPYLHVVVTRDGGPLYDGPLTDMPVSFEAAPTFAEPGEGNSHTYAFTVSFPAATPDADDAQGNDAVVAFAWEARMPE
jgi:hypothetical protein